MIDKFKIHVRGGDGGAGCNSFRKSIQARHGSADGTQVHRASLVICFVLFSPVDFLEP
jgi:GTPase involved in cell partitioning and DNA repair